VRAWRARVCGARRARVLRHLWEKLRATPRALVRAHVADAAHRRGRPRRRQLRGEGLQRSDQVLHARRLRDHLAHELPRLRVVGGQPPQDQL
jgi:hypothetical protein